MIASLQMLCRKFVPARNSIVLIAISYLSVTQTFVNAQQNSSDTKRSTSLMLQFFGPETLGLNLNYNATKRTSLNVGLGVGLDVHIGSNFYLTDRNVKRFAWFGGLQLYFIRKVRFPIGDIFGSMGSSISTDKRKSQVGVYFPIGFEYIAKKGFTIQVDIGPNLVGKDWGQTNTAPIMGSFKIGYTFKPKS